MNRSDRFNIHAADLVSHTEVHTSEARLLIRCFCKRGWWSAPPK
jgi:hypothetical protein